MGPWRHVEEFRLCTKSRGFYCRKRREYVWLLESSSWGKKLAQAATTTTTYAAATAIALPFMTVAICYGKDYFYCPVCP